MEDLRSAMRALGYADSWLSAGVVDASTVLAQYEHAQGPDGDNSVEHYRAGALRDFLKSSEQLSDEQVGRLLTVGRDELATVLHGHIFHELLRYRALTPEQFERVAGAWDDAGYARIVTRLRLLRALDAGPIDEALLQRALRDGDASVHEALLTSTALNDSIVDWLIEHGANKAVRNQAMQRKRSRSKR